MEYGTGELVFTMLKAMGIGLGAGYLIWGYGRGGNGAKAAISETTTAGSSVKTAPADAAPAAAQADTPEPQAPSGLLTSRPDEVDDLQKIKGVGPKMEQILNQKGVWQYRQIAAFEQADLIWLDKATGSFPGRAERDDWIGQAKGLEAAKPS